MASVFKPSGRNFYRIEFKDQFGVPRTVATQMTDKSDARQLAAKLDHDVARVRAGMPADHIDVTGPYLGLYRAGRPWPEFREEYANRILAGLAPRARDEAADSLDRFERLMNPKVVAAIKTETVDDFIARRRREPGKKQGTLLSSATINKDLRHLKASLRAAADWGYLPSAPKVRFQREAGRLKGYVTPRALYRDLPGLRPRHQTRGAALSAGRLVAGVVCVAVHDRLAN